MLTVCFLQNIFRNQMAETKKHHLIVLTLMRLQLGKENPAPMTLVIIHPSL